MAPSGIKMVMDECSCPARNDEAIVTCSLVFLLGVQEKHKTTHDRGENRCFSTILLLQGLCAKYANPALMLCLAIKSIVTMTMRVCLFEVAFTMMHVSRPRGVQVKMTTNHGMRISTSLKDFLLVVMVQISLNTLSMSFFAANQ
jgi:hypothetical protein